MSFVAIIGSGPLGGALAHKLASRDRVREIRLIDPEEQIARGKALDIRQSSPIEHFSTLVAADSSIAAAAGAAAVVIADAAKGGLEIGGESGLALLRQLASNDAAAPVVCAGASHAWLISRAVNELHLHEGRIVGSAPLALESALRALTGLAMDVSGAAIELAIVGIPPDRTVVAWEEASAFGQPLAAQLAPHAIAKLNDRLAELWPPGPYVLASAAARVVEALVTGSRRRVTCFASIGRGHVSARPVELGPDGVVRVLQPVLTRQEQTRLENAVEN